VGAYDTEGTRRLHREVSKHGAAAVARKYAAGRRQPEAPKAARAWTGREDELVRALPAREAARRTGRTITAVYQRRANLRRGSSR
jgi:hypothetical protein